jgi:hypothetical protein
MRQTFAEVPRRVEYSLNHEKCFDIIYVINSMRTSSQRWLYDRYRTGKFSLTLSMIEEPEGHPRFLYELLYIGVLTCNSNQFTIMLREETME